MPLLGAMCHVGITVSDLNGAMEFFKPFLEFLGYEIWDEIRNPNGQRVRVTVNHGNGAVFNLWEAKPEFAKHPFEVYEVGLHHIAFYTDTREQVDRACELAKRLGAKVPDGPGEFPYDPEGWYAVYFLGPDGLKFEVVDQPSAVKRYAETKRLRGEPPGDSVSAMHIPDFMRHVNRVFTNPIMGPVARVMPPLAMIHHVGRTSGRNYSTPVVAFRSTERFVIPMTYGRDVDWARNVVSAHGCEIEQMGRRFTTSNPRVVDFATAGPELPGAMREAFRIADLPGYLLLDLQPD